MKRVGYCVENRRLVAVLIADIAGYTSLIEQDTDATVMAWKTACADVIEPAIAEHSGRIVKLTGDGFLSEFASVQDAVLCAINMQKSLAASMLNFRMGVNLGDIVDDGQDIHGEGINIAARIEAMADDGGICISGLVYESVRNRIDAVYTDMGEHEVKHVSHPVRVYAINSGIAPATKTAPLRQEEKASIAILPFDNISNDPEQEYFCDGMVEDIITEISKFRWLSVIARNSTFTYKGKSVDIKTVGQELGVRYVVEGSVRKAGNRIRVNAQLIDSTDGSHVWAERYDRELDDIFDLQDEITQTLVGIIEPELANRERERIRVMPTNNMNAWELCQRGLSHRWKYTPEDTLKAHEYFSMAISIDPEFAAAYAHRAWTYHLQIVFSMVDDVEVALATGVADGKRAISLNDRDALGFCALGFISTVGRSYIEAQHYCRHALELNPNYATAYYGLALSLVFDTYDNRDEALKLLDMAIRLSPNDPQMWSFLNLKGIILFENKKYEEAQTIYQLASQFPNIMFWIPAGLAATIFKLGKEKQAKEIIEKACNDYPGLSLAWFITYLGPATKINGEFLDALKSAGLPETSAP